MNDSGNVCAAVVVRTGVRVIGLTFTPIEYLQLMNKFI